MADRSATKASVLEALRTQSNHTCIGRVVGAFGPGSPAARAYDFAEVGGKRHKVGDSFVSDEELEAMARALNGGVTRDASLLKASASAHAGLLDAYRVVGPGLDVTVGAAAVGGGGARAAVERAVREAFGHRAEGAPDEVTCGGKRWRVGKKLSGFVVREVGDAG